VAAGDTASANPTAPKRVEHFEIETVPGYPKDEEQLVAVTEDGGRRTVVWIGPADAESLA
jgi:hypothetical protein